MVTSIFKKKEAPPISILKHFDVSSSKFFLASLLIGRNEACAFLKIELCRTGGGRKAPTSPEFLHLIITKLNLRFIQARDVKTPSSASPGRASGPHMCQTPACGRGASGGLSGPRALPQNTAGGAGASLENLSLPQRFAWLPARRAEAGLGLPAPQGSRARLCGQTQGGAGGLLGAPNLCSPTRRRVPRAVWWVSAARSEQLPGPASGGRYEEAASLPQGGGEAQALQPATLQPRRPGEGTLGHTPETDIWAWRPGSCCAARSRRLHRPWSLLHLTEETQRQSSRCQLQPHCQLGGGPHLSSRQ